MAWQGTKHTCRHLNIGLWDKTLSTAAAALWYVRKSPLGTMTFGSSSLAGNRQKGFSLFEERETVEEMSCHHHGNRKTSITLGHEISICMF